ncbi:MAG: hypothetical protein K940chlam2_00995 [Chlamydiae bacterium]|nr:hypothetical protein [Chlamydiota bacterium]
MERFSMPYALLATQLALLGRITPELRAVEISLSFEDEKLIMSFYFDREASDDTLENWSIASMEVSASLCCFSENHFEYLNAFEEIPIQGQLAYLRKPPKDPENINLEFLSREIISFKERVGHFVNPINGHSIDTSWGVVHRTATKPETIPAIPKTHKIDTPLLAFVELSIQKALLGRASSELRAVTLQYDEKNKVCNIRFYFDGDIPKNLIGLWEYAVSEIIASAWPFCEFNTEITRLDEPQQIPETGMIKYLRQEAALSDGL